MTIDDNASLTAFAETNIPLTANQPPARFYRGGDRISQFRQSAPSAPYTPEDWVASTTAAFGTQGVGLTRLPGGDLLVDAIRQSPGFWLGDEHIDRFGADSRLLVKLLDAGERLPIHVHPNGEFAATHLAAPHGKAEAWYILAPGIVRLGLIRDVAVHELQGFVDAHDGRALMPLMHEREVQAGDTVFVPPGLLHAIGEGILLVEVQEPADFSILLEWDGFDIDGERLGHLGLGFDIALGAVDTRRNSPEQIDALIRRRPKDGAVLPEIALNYFRLDHTSQQRRFNAGFSVIICVEGPAVLTTAGAQRRLSRGTTVLMPHAAGDFEIGGECLVARPPLPS